MIARGHAAEESRIAHWARIRADVERVGVRCAAAPWVPAALVALGVVLRLRRWGANIGFKIGECELALNLVSRSYAGLLRPLDDEQGAPIGYPWLTKALLEGVGNDERALRGVAILAGVASVPLFWAVARRALPRTAALFALALFAVAPKLIQHSAELKQYSSDVAVTLTLLLAALAVQRDERASWRLAGLALVGALAPWLSHAAALVLAGIGAVLGVQAIARRDGRRVVALLAVSLLWDASLGALWWVSLRHLTQSEFLQAYWHRGFMPLPPRSLADLRWFPEMLIRTFEDPGYFVPAAFAASACVMGAVAWLRESPASASLVLAPIAATLLVSGFRQYPFMNRLITFLLPSFLMAVGAGLEALRRAVGPRAPWIFVLFAGWLAFDSVASEALRFFVPKHHEDAREVMAVLAREWRPGDGIYLYSSSRYPFRYYAPRFGLAPEDGDVHVGRSSDGLVEDDLADVRGMPRLRRVWLMFSHVFQADLPTSEERAILALVERGGVRPLAHHQEVGASLHLYDLSGMRELSSAASE